MTLRAALVAAALVAGGGAFAEGAPTGHRVAVNDYEVSGAGDPLIVLHGAYMNIPSMGEIIPMIAEGRRVHALEFQGHGRTTDIERPITYLSLADDVAAFMDAVGIERADVFGYSMGAPEKVGKLVAASVAYDVEGWQPAFREFIPQMTVEMFTEMPFAAEHRELAADPDGFPALVEKLIVLEHEPMAWEKEVKALENPVLIITSDADVVTLEHSVAGETPKGCSSSEAVGDPCSTGAGRAWMAWSASSFRARTGRFVELHGEPMRHGEATTRSMRSAPIRHWQAVDRTSESGRSHRRRHSCRSIVHAARLALQCARSRTPQDETDAGTSRISLAFQG